MESRPDEDDMNQLDTQLIPFSHVQAVTWHVAENGERQPFPLAGDCVIQPVTWLKRYLSPFSAAR
jgi:hypothetical protein